MPCEKPDANSHCHNCFADFDVRKAVYRIQRGTVWRDVYKGYLFEPEEEGLLLCPDCYDDTWVIGEPTGPTHGPIERS